MGLYRIAECIENKSFITIETYIRFINFYLVLLLMMLVVRHQRMSMMIGQLKTYKYYLVNNLAIKNMGFNNKVIKIHQRV